MVARRIGVGLLTIAFVGALGASPALALSPTSSEGEQLLSSDAPKTVMIDTRTGDVTAVYSGFPPAEASNDESALHSWIALQK
jgi:hypothetical protein